MMKFKSKYLAFLALVSIQLTANASSFRAANVDDQSFYQELSSPTETYMVNVPYSDKVMVSVKIDETEYRRVNESGLLQFRISVRSLTHDFIYSNTFITTVNLKKLDVNWAAGTFRVDYSIQSTNPEHSFGIRSGLDSAVSKSAVIPFLQTVLNNTHFNLIDDKSSFMNSMANYYLKSGDYGLYISIKP